MGLHRPLGGCQGSTDHLQQRALAAAIAADDSQGFPPSHLKAHVPQGPEFTEILSAVSPEGLLQPIFGAVVDAVALPQVVHTDHHILMLVLRHGCAHITSAKARLAF